MTKMHTINKHDVCINYSVGTILVPILELSYIKPKFKLLECIVRNALLPSISQVPN